VTWRSLATAAALMALVGVLDAPSAAAHAVLLKATPSSSESLSQPPDIVQLLFSEPLDPIFSAVRVLNASGQVVDRGDSHVAPDNNRLLVISLQLGLPNGVYAVWWHSLSAIDVHPDEGRYSLFVGVPVSPDAAGVVSNSFQITATPETSFGRWWFYVAASLFGGVLATWKFVLGPVLVGEHADLRNVARRRAFRLILIGGLLLIVGTLFTAVAQAAAAAGVSLTQATGKPLTDLLLRGRFASIWWPRMGLEVASVALIAFGGVEGLAAECALATLPAVLLTSALTSHGAALPQGAGAGIAIDWLHIVGATAWVGGLIAVLTCVAAMRRVEGAGALVRRLIGRFGRFGLVASMAVLLSGVMQGALELGSWTALVGTLYGQLILIKVGMLALMLALAGLNELQARYTTEPGLGVRRGVRVELALGVVVFGVAAVLSGTPPSPNY
jgi:copper transport protein